MAAGGGGKDVLLRFRTRGGVWRLGGVSPSWTVEEVLARLAEERGVDGSKLTLHDRMGTPAHGRDRVLRDLRVRDGHLFFLDSSEDLTAATLRAAEESAPSGAGAAAPKGKVKITGDGKIVRKTYEDSRAGQGFRPGMGALRDMQKQWTWNDFMDLNKSLEFHLKRQTERSCARATLDTGACVDFQSYLASLAYRTCRIGFLLGFFTPDREVVAVAIYEPPQENSETECLLTDDPDEARAVDTVMALLGLERVGVVFSHPPRPDAEGKALSGPELILAGKLQLTASRLAAAEAGEETSGEGAPPPRAPTPFVTVRVTADEEGRAMFDAYQVSEQFLDMVERGAVKQNPDKPAEISIDPRFHAIVEAKPAESVPIEFFLVNVPIAQETYFLHTTFPRSSRTGAAPTKSDLAALLRRSKDPVQALRDFHALVYIAKQGFLASEVLPEVADAVLDPHGTLTEGHLLMIHSFTEES